MGSECWKRTAAGGTGPSAGLSMRSSTSVCEPEEVPALLVHHARDSGAVGHGRGRGLVKLITCLARMESQRSRRVSGRSQDLCPAWVGRVQVSRNAWEGQGSLRPRTCLSGRMRCRAGSRNVFVLGLEDFHHWSVRELKVTSHDNSTGRDTTWRDSGRRDGPQSESSSDVMIVWGSTLLPSDPGIA